MDLLAQSQASRERKRYKLTGHSLVGDKRTTPIRGDLADIKLAGKLFAPHYAVPLQRSIVTATAAIREFPDAKSMGASELVYGEGFAVLDVAGDWAWGYGVHDDYLGYVRMESLGDPVEPTHVVTATGTLLFDKPNIRSAVMMRLPMGARLVSGGDSECGQFLLCGDAFVPKTHVEEIGKVAESAVDLSERLVGTPYLWGGRSGDGIDCSGMVQMTHGLAGTALPRDADMQEAADLGTAVPEGAPLQRGDLIYFPGHVGIMIDGENIVHANSRWMQVSIEPLTEVASRFEGEESGPITARRRL